MSHRERVYTARPKRRIRGRYIEDDYNVQCDRCGNWKQASQCLLEWTGLFVCGSCWEPRNIQDFVKSISEDIAPPIPRPVTGLPQVLCTLEGQSCIAGLAVAGCSIAGYDPNFYLGGLSPYTPPSD